MPRFNVHGDTPASTRRARRVDGLREDRRRSRAVARVVVRPRGDLFDHLRADILDLLLELDLLGDRDPVLLIVGAPQLFSMPTLRPFRAEGDADRVCERVHAALDALPGAALVSDFLAHREDPLESVGPCPSANGLL